MEFLTTESGYFDKEINVLVITDHFTHWTQTFYPSQTASLSVQDIMG